MKKRIIAAIIAALMLICSVPLISGCKAGVTYILNEDNASYTVKVTGFSSAFGGEFTVPSTYGENNLPVTAIADEGFASTNITKITIPDTVEYVGQSAFLYCGSLKEVVFEGESRVKNILSGAFTGCANLKSINLPQTLQYILPQAFMGCESLKSVELPETLERIGYRAFYQSGLERIIIPASIVDETVPVLDDKGEQEKDDKGNPVTSTLMGIGYGAFHSCVNLKFAVVNAEIETLYAGVFGYCLALESIYLPATLKKVEGEISRNGSLIYGHAFHHDPALKNVYFAGTEEQWNAIEVVNKEFKDKQVETPYDNSAIINAQKTFNAVYGG